MKTSLFNRLSVKLMALMIMSAFVFVACQDQNEVLDQLTSELEEETTLPFAKLLTITDASGNNSLDVRISSTDQSVLEMYNSETFSLVMEDDFASMAEVEETGNEQLVQLSDFDAEGAIRINFELLKQDFVNPESQFRMLENLPESLARAKTWKTYTSSNDEAEVTLDSRWYNIFVTLSSQQNSGDPFNATLTNKEIKKKGDSEVICAPNSYRIKVEVKARNHTNHYYITWAFAC
ncbi:MAG: hypothetical protein AAF587_36370 [Bacteroidota bacterium]